MYRTIDARFWTDPKVRKLSPQAKLLFLYLVTNAHSHVSGIYHLPRALVAHELDLPVKAVNSALDTLSALKLVRLDRDTDIVWVVNMMAYQGSGEKTERSAAFHLFEDLHNCSLTKDFLKAYPSVEQWIKPEWRYPKDRVSGAELAQDTPDSSLLTPEIQTPDSTPPTPANGGGGGDTPDPFAELVERWNAIKGVTACRAKTPGRRDAFRVRSKDAFWREHVAEALERVAASSFCRGGGDRGWKADIDWFLRPGTVAGLIEGKYDDRNGRAHGLYGGLPEFVAAGGQDHESN